MASFLIDVLLAEVLDLSVVIVLFILLAEPVDTLELFSKAVKILSRFVLTNNIVATILILVGQVNVTESGRMNGQSIIVQGMSNLLANENLILGWAIFVFLIYVPTMFFARRANLTVKKYSKVENKLYSDITDAMKLINVVLKWVIAVTCINLLGGIFVGTVIGKLSFAESVAIYTKLTLGNGLAALVPLFALIFSIILLSKKRDKYYKSITR